MLRIKLIPLVLIISLLVHGLYADAIRISDFPPEETIQRINHLSTVADIEFYVALIPSRTEDPEYLALNAAIANSNSRPKGFVDLSKVFEYEQSIVGEVVFSETGELSEAGKRIVARTMVEKVEPGIWDVSREGYESYYRLLLRDFLEDLRSRAETTIASMTETEATATPEISPTATVPVVSTPRAPVLVQVDKFSSVADAVPIENELMYRGFVLLHEIRDIPSDTEPAPVDKQITGNILLISDHMLEADSQEIFTTFFDDVAFLDMTQASGEELTHAISQSQRVLLLLSEMPDSLAELETAFVLAMDEQLEHALVNDLSGLNGVYMQTDTLDYLLTEDGLYPLNGQSDEGLAELNAMEGTLTHLQARALTFDEKLAVRDVAAEVGLWRNTSTFTANVADVNDDSLDDLIITYHKSYPDHIKINADGLFVPYSGNLPMRDRHDCVFGRVNDDDLIDMYCTLGGERGTGSNNNELWVQTEAGFEDRAREYNVSDPFGRGRLAGFVNFPDDDLPMLYVANQYPRQDDKQSINHLFMNHGGVFVSEDDRPVTGERGWRCLNIADIDGNGYEDIAVCDPGRLYVFMGDASGYQDLTANLGFQVSGAVTDIEFAYMNDDQWIDAVVLYPGRVQIMHGNGLVFRESGRIPTSSGWKLAVADFTGDGLNDVYVVTKSISEEKCFDPTEIRINAPDSLYVQQADGFQQVTFPYTELGCGGDVDIIDVDQDGVPEILVLNGENATVGPIQLFDMNQVSGN